MPAKYKRILRPLAVLAVVALAWQFGIKPRMKRYETWSGVVKEHYFLYGQSTVGADRPTDPSKSRRFYWKIECDDGAVRDEVIPHKLWRSVPDDARVIKESGKRYPTVVPGEVAPPPVAAPPVEPEAAAPVSPGGEE